MSKPARILVLPGHGDIYWVAVVLEDFCKQKGLDKPELHIWNFDGRPRSLEYVERIPFVTAAGYFDSPRDSTPEFTESYMLDGRTVYPGFKGFDYYLAVNGPLRQGKTVEEAFPGLKSNWFFPHLRTPAEQKYADELRLMYPEGYIAACFSDNGMFRHWTNSWPAEKCAKYVQEVEQLTGLPVLLTGSPWDASFSAKVAKLCGARDLAGKTNPDAFFALFRNARGTTGWCGGNTILATAFGVPTLMFWHRYFPNPKFYVNACPPESLHRWYEAASVDMPQSTPMAMAQEFATLVENDLGSHIRAAS